MDRDKIVWLVAGLFFGAIIIAIAFLWSRQTRPAPIYISPPAPTLTPLPSPTASPMRVYISGEVEQPDVYELPVGAILQDAVQAAGGFTEAADDERLNLALPLNDGMHVHVPNLTEEVLVEPAGIESNPGPSATGSIVNINTAGLAELELLPGIGPATAQKIIDYRQDNGPFSTIEEVQNVSGIGPVKYEQILQLITVQ